MNRRGFLKLCGMVVAMPSLPAATLAKGLTVQDVVAFRNEHVMFRRDYWAKELFEYSMSNMVLTNYIVNKDGSHTMKDLIRRFPLEAA